MFLQERAKEINEKLKELKNVSNIVIWAAGIHTAKLFERTQLLSYDISSIVDMNEKKHGDYFFGFVIENPEKMCWSDVGAVVISVPNQEKKIREILRKQLGYQGIITELYDENKCTPFHLLYDEKIPNVRYLGDYRNWNDAARECEGYEDSIIINKVINATQKVLHGDAVWERDSFLFYQEKYVHRICAMILKCALQNKNCGVRILDIGGSLGSTYFQNRKYLEDVKKLEYVVAEQEHFSDYGHKHLEDSILKFIRNNDSWEKESFDIILMSASLQYISDYGTVISKIKEVRPRYIILDRLLISDRTRICKETVPETIYESSYPLIIFSEEEIRSFFEPDYKLVENDSSSVPENAYFVDGKAESRYYVFDNLPVI